MIKIFWNPKSRAERMFWAMEEIGQPYELQKIDISVDDRNDPPEFLTASPLRKVPALTDGALKMADSGGNRSLSCRPL